MIGLTVSPLAPQQIAECWRWLGPLLAPAIAVDDNAQDVKALLERGQYEAALLTDDTGRGVVVTERCTVDGVECLWLPYIAGSTGRSPKDFIRLMRDIMTLYEDIARQSGASEIRIGGRDWSRIFPDFERFDDKPNRLRKKL